MRVSILIIISLLAACSSAMKDEFNCNVPNQGVCRPLSEINALVDNGYFDDQAVIPQPVLST